VEGILDGEGPVYVGTVVSVDSTARYEEFRFFTLAVEQTIRDMPDTTTVVASRWDGAACGIELEVGQTYLMMPNARSLDARELGVPTIGLCDPPWLIEKIPEIIEGLLAATPVSAVSWGDLKSTSFEEQVSPRGCRQGRWVSPTPLQAAGGRDK